MAFHTLVAKKVAIDENKPLTLLSENSAILRKLAWPGSKSHLRFRENLKYQMIKQTTNWLEPRD